MSDVILHHYPQSPVSEKVRLGLGIKALPWRSVLIPRLPPKPDLIPLTGGYRRTPVMQIGADVFCDSQCILRELERRFPAPSFHPGTSPGTDWGLSRWTDGELFTLAIKVVLGAGAESLPADFAQDRSRLYLGPESDLMAIKTDLPHLVGQLRGHLGWMDDGLSTGMPFMTGERPGLGDILCYYLIWFLRGRWSGGPELLSDFAFLVSWEERIRQIGHGRPSDLEANDALAVAKRSDPKTPETVDPLDPQNLTKGVRVTISPEGDGGDPDVEGQLHFADRYSIAILRDDPRIGTVCVHFPRVGYRITAH